VNPYQGQNIMSKLSEITPTSSPRMMDLVAAAGVDVSDWGNFKGGKKKAASNPKYCYEWSFVEPKKVVVLNLWHDLMEENDDGIIMRSINMREFASKRPAPEKGRSLKMDAAIQTAIKEKLPIRVIVLGGRRRNINSFSESASRVSTRLLDPVTWSVAKYDWQNGACTLKQGADRFVDQFSIGEEPMQPPERRTVSGQVFNRSAEVRKKVLSRANGKCEWCETPGFVTSDGKIYLETHHIIPLSENGLDRVSNVVALCANHHREAHHGKNKAVVRETLLKRFDR
jgi:5-methylcytosine-specific restriction protein A